MRRTANTLLCAALAGLAAGCFQLDVPQGLTCSDTPPFCPDGQSCVAGVCMTVLPPDADPNAPDADPNPPDAGPCETNPELCNGVDDNCNDMTDEGFALDVTCDGSQDMDLCQEGHTICSTDGLSTQCEDTSGETTETCNGADDNCDGTSDEGCSCVDGSAMPCGTDVGACMAGAQQCVGGTWGTCMGGVGPTGEICNGADDDCDGPTDEDFPLGSACSVGVGGCLRTGSLICNGSGSGTDCSAVPGSPTAEGCNGVDDDCDGPVDEGNPGGGGSCPTGLPGVCNDGITQCIGGSLSCQQTVFGSGEVCNGLDDNCDANVNEGFGLGTDCDGPDGDYCYEGYIVCDGAGGTTCDDATGTEYEYPCDGYDNDCDGYDETYCGPSQYCCSPYGCVCEGCPCF